ncbi:MAG: ABC transporter permease [Muribaculaceae bacterium]|nr:ABC transporter permease [Muribaculaceae bacterium]MDE5924051.1 ABC transporter permease [Muribaculaceae bacterium]
MSPFCEIFKRSVLQLVRRPVYWVAMFLLPLFVFLFLSSLMAEGLPQKAPAGVIDNDGSPLSRKITQNLNGMQMVDITAMPESFTEARHMMQEGKIYGFFLIPHDFEADLLAGRSPEISFYTNMTYFVPASLLFKTFKTTALFAKAGVASEVISSVGFTQNPSPLLQPVNIVTRPISNPGLNYAIYLCVSFLPATLQLMIILVTCFSLGQEIKYHASRRLLEMARGSIVRAIYAKLLPQTLIWTVIVIFMESWLFRWQGYPMHGSWWWLTLSEILFVLASQGFGLICFGIFPNLRLSLSMGALIGILSFSVAAFSFPVESMYPAIGIFSWVVPIRYNYLIYVDQALNGIDIYYSRYWFAAYFIFIVLPFALMPRLKRAFAQQAYVP